MKNTIRTRMREQRQALSAALYVKKSGVIAEKLLANEAYASTQKILVYLSSKQEVETHALIARMLKDGKELYAPLVNGDSFTAHPFQKLSELKEGSFGSLEPKPSKAETDFDIILVPGLAFDQRGHRIGYGQGFYDRFLKEATGLKIGLAFQEQMLEEIPNDEQDVPVNFVITDSPTKP
jgi:5-formyltetrahydrofolate cyclo-ligase